MKAFLLCFVLVSSLELSNCAIPEVSGMYICVMKNRIHVKDLNTIEIVSTYSSRFVLVINQPMRIASNKYILIYEYLCVQQ